MSKRSNPLNESSWKRISLSGGDWRYKVYNQSVLLENPKGDRNLIEVENITGLSKEQTALRQAFGRNPVDPHEIRDYIEKINV